MLRRRLCGGPVRRPTRLDGTRTGRDATGGLSQNCTAIRRRAVATAEGFLVVTVVITGETMREKNLERKRASVRYTRGRTTFQKYHARGPIAILTRVHDDSARPRYHDEREQDGRRRNEAVTRARACPLCPFTLRIYVHAYATYTRERPRERTLRYAINTNTHEHMRALVESC